MIFYSKESEEKQKNKKYVTNGKYKLLPDKLQLQIVTSSLHILNIEIQCLVNTERQGKMHILYSIHRKL